MRRVVVAAATDRHGSFHAAGGAAAGHAATGLAAAIRCQIRRTAAPTASRRRFLLHHLNLYRRNLC